MLSRMLAVCTIACAAIVGTAGASAAEAPKADVLGTQATAVVIVSVGSRDRCLDLTSYNSGTRATLYGCHSGPSQIWVLENNGTISSYGSGRRMCLDVTTYNDNAPVHLYGCHGGPSQRWILSSNYTVRNEGGNKCLDLQSYNDYSPAVIYPCHGGPSQQWASR
ncbi:RICIN domain-containing protein [Actinokineospora sp. NBRC 105648]|uniref:RICIN domain-containing protein n=1 Tax=Actinokineospora sp. NBRC 105648 TaxID=3032206 RepID=UPI0024A2F298|nr:RICIN domain-containing protein [Actinokineospora sp. NBRC 105648]GLZ37125.1 hypothetical protein Acsp05_07500 [Actinokineospora sp. NBRC 105648]